MKGVPDSSNPKQQFIDGYWLTVISLIKQGIPWDLINTASSEDMILILASLQAVTEHENELQERQVRQQQARI